MEGMSKRLKRMLLVVIMCGSVVYACTKEAIVVDSGDVSHNDDIEEICDKSVLLRDISLLLGEVLKERNLLVQIRDYVRLRGDNSESISLNVLLGGIKISEYERELFKQKGVNTTYFTHFNGLLKDRIIAVLKRSDVSHTKSLIADIKTLYNYLSNCDIELYIPYEEEFDWSGIDKITITYDPLVRESWNYGICYSVCENESSCADMREAIRDSVIVNDDYAFRNPTIIIRFAESRTVSQNSEDQYRFSGWASNCDSLNSPLWDGWLTHNVDYTTIHQNDILKVVIPKIRLTQHLGTIFSSSTISLYRVSGNLSLDENGIIIPSATQYRILYKFDIKRRDTRLGLWTPVNIIWDGDWDMHEANQQIVFISHHTFYWVDKTIDGKVGIGYDNKKKCVVPEAKVTAYFTFGIDGGDIRYNNQISRRDALAHIVGDNGAGTVIDDNVAYSVKSADLLRYYFKYYYTQIVPK